MVIGEKIIRIDARGFVRGGGIKFSQPYPGGLFEGGVYSSRGSVRVFRIIDKKDNIDSMS